MLFYFIFVHFRLFTVFDFGLVHYASEPFNWSTPCTSHATNIAAQRLQTGSCTIAPTTPNESILDLRTNRTLTMPDPCM